MKKISIQYFFSRSFRQSILIAFIVVVVGIILAASPYGHQLEEYIGLPWLFKLRGEIAASKDVIIVSIDQESALALNLPIKPRKWPRNLHGQLVDKLVAHGVTAIGFDVIFDEIREPELNKYFAQSIRKADNVILFQLMEQKEIFDNITHKKLPLEKISLINPIEIFTDAAKGISPFPLPKVPAQINHVVLYKSIFNNIPTLPVTMLQLHTRSVHKNFLSLIEIIRPLLMKKFKQSMSNNHKQQSNIQNTIRELRKLFLENPKLAEQITSYLKKTNHNFSKKQLKKLRGLMSLYQVPDSVYLNYYGQVGSIKTIPYHVAISSDPANPTIDVKNKAVFVGFSEQFQPQQKDGFNTVYTNDKNGSEISGVEIIATTFSNLIEQQLLKVSSGLQDITIIIVWGVLIILLLHSVPVLYLFPVTLILGLIYGVTVYYSFVVYYYWLPFIIPLFIQLSIACLLTFIFQYRKLQFERQLIRQAFGYHLPKEVVDKIAKGINNVTASGEKVHGIVMATDAQQYTKLSEKLNSNDLQNLMNQYYEVMFTQIRLYEGIISDVVGDAAMAIWTADTKSKNDKYLLNQVKCRQQACLAALAIKSAVDNFNIIRPELALPTRIGLDCGEFVIGHIGALDHYEYRAIGDIVNTASRIEGVNKLLDTNIIVSEEVLKGTENLISRKLGRFKLLGKKNEITLHELVAHNTMEISSNEIEINVIFKQGLIHFQAGEFELAKLLFRKIICDGPSRFYDSLCDEYSIKQPLNFNGAVSLDNK